MSTIGPKNPPANVGIGGQPQPAPSKDVSGGAPAKSATGVASLDPTTGTPANVAAQEVPGDPATVAALNHPHNVGGATQVKATQEPTISGAVRADRLLSRLRANPSAGREALREALTVTGDGVQREQRMENAHHLANALVSRMDNQELLGLLQGRDLLVLADRIGGQDTATPSRADLQTQADTLEATDPARSQAMGRLLGLMDKVPQVDTSKMLQTPKVQSFQAALAAALGGKASPATADAAEISPQERSQLQQKFQELGPDQQAALAGGTLSDGQQVDGYWGDSGLSALFGAFE